MGNDSTGANFRPEAKPAAVSARFKRLRKNQEATSAPKGAIHKGRRTASLSDALIQARLSPGTSQVVPETIVLVRGQERKSLNRDEAVDSHPNVAKSATLGRDTRVKRMCYVSSSVEEHENTQSLDFARDDRTLRSAEMASREFPLQTFSGRESFRLLEGFRLRERTTPSRTRAVRFRIRKYLLPAPVVFLGVDLVRESVLLAIDLGALLLR